MDRTSEDIRRNTQEFIKQYGIIDDDDFTEEHGMTDNDDIVANIEKLINTNKNIKYPIYVTKRNVRNNTISVNQKLQMIQAVLCIVMFIEILLIIKVL